METKEIMDTYEKKYNEALKWMRELYPGIHGATKEDAEHYFPELCESESEDERIRKALIMLVQESLLVHQGCCKCFHEFTEEQLLAWLEKQKEPENTSTSTMAPSCWECEQKEQKQTDLPAGFYYIDMDGKRYYSKEFRYGDMKLKVGEQKPVEKQDYSGLNDLERAIHRGFLVAGVENVPVTIIKETAQDCLAHLPAEWSEEDEERLKSVIHRIEVQFAGNLYGEGKLDVAWLKSLRPSWKPSEVHLSALLAIFNDPNNIDSQTCQLALTDLYEQLKKL